MYFIHHSTFTKGLMVSEYTRWDIIPSVIIYTETGEKKNALFRIC